MKESFIDRTMMYSLIFTTVFSWFLFPFLLKFLYPSVFKISFLLILLAVFLMHWKYSNVNKFEFSREQKIFFFLWAGYLFALMVSTIYANDFYAYKQFLSNCLKVMFFIFILLLIDKVYIYKTFTIYANLMVISVIAALAVSIGVGMEILEPISTLRNEENIENHYLFDVYWGSYYRLSAVYAPFPLFRMQGFSEEPGTFAFALMPAIFWMLIVKKAIVRTLILGVGVLGSYSIGIGLVLLGIIPLLLKVRSIRSTEILFVSGLLSLLLLMFIIPIKTGMPLFQWIAQLDYPRLDANSGGLSAGSGGGLSAGSGPRNADEYNAYAWSSGFIENKTPSMTLRYEAILIVGDYLSKHPFGTGAGLGMTTVDYAIAVGFANAALESGGVGGVFYILMFLLLTWFAIQMVWKSDISSSEDKMRIAIGLSVLACMMMGLQRQQPDISFWHMWIYAALFYLTLKPKAGDSQI